VGPGEPFQEKIANYKQKKLRLVHIFVTILYIFVICYTGYVLAPYRSTAGHVFIQRLKTFLNILPDF